MWRQMMKMGSLVLSGLMAGCIAQSGGGSANSDSEVAASVVSGALNESAGSMVGWNDAPRIRKSPLRRALDAVKPVSTAYAASWSCSGDSLSPSYAGPGDYAFTPVSCTVSWDNGLSASATWSSTFDVDYGASCDTRSPSLALQPGGCAVTRTTAAGGNTRTITGPDGDSYAIKHDTNGAGSGWDASVSPAPTNGGVIATCAAGGCGLGGGNLVISGSHLTGTVSDGKHTLEIWDHTVSTAAGGLTVSGAGDTRVVSGAVNVQHNLLKYTAVASFNAVGYGEAGCCFPTTGSVSTTFANGPYAGKTETLAFSKVCGDATLTTASGKSIPITLTHCL